MVEVSLHPAKLIASSTAFTSSPVGAVLSDLAKFIKAAAALSSAALSASILGYFRVMLFALQSRLTLLGVWNTPRLV